MTGTNPPPEGFRFYVCRIAPRGVAKAVDALSERGVYACAPSETVWRRTLKGRKRQSRPLLVGYLFVALDPQAPAFRAVREAAPDLGPFVGSGSPRPVPVGFVEALAQAEAEGRFDKTRKPERAKFTPGQQVRVVSGPCAGLVGAFVEARGTDRARVLLALLGGEAAVEVGSDKLAAA